MWAYRITPKQAIGMSPFQVLYGIDAKIPISIEFLALQLAKAIGDENFQSSIEKRIMYLARLQEERSKVVDHITYHQIKFKIIFDKKSKQHDF